MKKFLCFLILSLLLVGCVKESQKISINKLMKENEYIIIDVRTKEEYSTSHIKGAINIPYDEIDENIKLDKNKIVFVYCESGNRSNIAFVRLINYGYEVYNLGAFNSIDLPKE